MLSLLSLEIITSPNFRTKSVMLEYPTERGCELSFYMLRKLAVFQLSEKEKKSNQKAIFIKF